MNPSLLAYALSFEPKRFTLDVQHSVWAFDAATDTGRAWAAERWRYIVEGIELRPRQEIPWKPCDNPMCQPCAFTRGIPWNE